MQLIKCVKWLAERTPEQPELTSCAIREFIDDVLNQHYFSSVYQDLAGRRKNGHLDQVWGTATDKQTQNAWEIGLLIMAQSVLCWVVGFFIMKTHYRGKLWQAIL